MSSSPSSTPETTLPFSKKTIQWSEKNSGQAFRFGNVLRVVGLGFIVAHALKYAKEGKPQYELFIFGLMQFIDILSRYPESLRAGSARLQVSCLAFSFLWAITVGIYAATFNKMFGIVFGLILLLVVVYVLLYTKPNNLPRLPHLSTEPKISVL